MEDDLLRLLAAEPGRAAILLDVDGTLSPIVDRPGDARVPEETRRELSRLAGRYALVACVSGRPRHEVERMIDVSGVAVVGEHGLELEPGAAEWVDRIEEFARGVDWPAERKPLSVSFHFRRADDEAAARAYLTRVAEAAAAKGLVPRWGRMVLEVRPPVDADKGTAVRALVTRAESAARSTPATTGRTSTPSPGWTGSSSGYASQSTRARRRPSCGRRPTSSSTGRTACSSSCAVSETPAPSRGRAGRLRPYRACASRRSTSQARRTSSSSVRAFPIARRSTNRSSRRVCERNTSPDAFTRSSRASFSSSDASRRKQTSEKWRGAQTSQPASSRYPALEELREAQVLADHGPQALAPVATEHGPQLEGTEAPTEWQAVLAQADDVLTDAQVLGDEAERVAQVVGAAAEERRAVNRREEPLVRVDAERVGPLPAGEERPQLRAHGGAPGVGGVDVQPGAGLPAAVGELRHGVDRGRRRRPDRRDNGTGVGQVELVEAHREALVARHGPELELEQACRLRRRRVGVLGADDDAPARCRRACSRERGDEARRRRVLDVPVEALRQPEQVCEPRERHLLELLQGG